MYHQMERLVQQHIRYDRISSIDESLEKIEAVTPEDIQNLANELFVKDTFHSLLLKPSDK
jgi:predicted Zn-dependent peptidase